MKIAVRTWDQLDETETASLTLEVRVDSLELAPAITTKEATGWLREKFSDDARAAVLARDSGNLIGWLLLAAEGPEVVEINPWVLGGHPIVDPESDWTATASALLTEATRWAREEEVGRINLITGMAEEEEEARYLNFYQEHGFKLKLKYVEMICPLSEVALPAGITPNGFEIAPLSTAAGAELYECYYQAFAAGDARFFFDQDEAERWDYFTSNLGYTDVVADPGSIILRQNGRLVAFVYVMPFGDKNRHISCMCVRPELQGQGLGRFLLDHVMSEVHKQGHKSITLGTETGMRAYELYKQNGFQVADGAIIYAWENPEL